jgi:hypothetical protein
MFNMLVLLHVLAALSSLMLASVLYFAPTRTKLKLTSALVAMTLASGTYLVVSANVRLVESCTMGLIYLGAVSLAMAGAYRKLATIKISARDRR